MAAKIQGADEQTAQSLRKESLILNELFVPKDTLDQPCDVVLVVEDGKEFKAHRKVLSEASPFFEKLLNSDMKESKKGVVRLEMFRESVMAATLEFIYTGHVQILAEENARDLIVMADYLFLQKLKSLAEGVLAQTLDISNCIPTYYLSKRYQCGELFSMSKKFILANFTAVYAANREDVLNMPSRELEMWISSDEIEVSAEEDLFKIILAWIDHDKSKRKKYFAELFRHVRLVYVSRDFLISDVLTNDLVKDNEGYLDLVRDTVDIIDSKNYDNLPVPPRKSFMTPIILTFTYKGIFCYFPWEDGWYCLEHLNMKKSHPVYMRGILYHRVVPCHGKLYAFKSSESMKTQVLEIFNPYSISWMVLPFLEENRVLKKVFVRNEDEMYALVSERSTIIISKYKPQSNSWEDVASFARFKLRRDVCIVAKDNFIYFIGGIKTFPEPDVVSDVDRYDFSKNQWDKVADIQEARGKAYGAAARGKILIVGGHGGWCYRKRLQLQCDQCEVYDETLNEWQFIKRFNMRRDAFRNLVSLDDKVYAVGFTRCETRRDCELRHIRVECYNFEKNEWEKKSETAMMPTDGKVCSLRIFKGFFNPRQLVKACPPDCLTEITNTQTSLSPTASQENASL
ncbi:hypothetical protein ACROYT_G037007 [Oculina patagonica]